MKRIIALLLLTHLLLLSFVSCKDADRFEYCEIGIILTREFSEYDSDGAFSVAYSDGNTIVGISRYSFVDCIEEGLLTTYTPLKLAEVILDRGDYITDGIKTEGDVVYFTYTNTDTDGNSYFYMPTFFRTPYAYFIITFITPKSREVVGRVEFLDYASSVYIIQDYL